jgi:hypothetical protein
MFQDRGWCPKKLMYDFGRTLGDDDKVMDVAVFVENMIMLFIQK